jgi:hypothetical protein
VSNGGIIGPPNVPTKSLASGVWTLGEQYLARVANIWPISVPAVVTNSVMWMDAADLSTITESGGSVSQWDNKGSLGNFTQGSGALQPTTGVSTLNGLNVLNFASDFLTAVNTNEWKFLHDGTDYLIAAVIKFGTTANPNTLYSLLGNNNRSSSSIGASVAYDDRSVASRNDRLLHEVFAGSSVINVQNVSSDNLAPANTFVIATVLGDPDNGTAAQRSSMFVNAGTAVTNNSSTGAVTASNPSFALQIGSNGNGGETLTGSIAEIVIVSGADATEGNRVIIRNYLNVKWGAYV